MIGKYYHQNKKFEKSNKFKEEEENNNEKQLFFWRTVINVVLSLILVIIFFLVSHLYATWKILFFIVIWSFWSNTFYIISITIIDICIYTQKNKCEKMNNWVRNYFLRILFPFSLGTVIIFWELVLLGEKYINIDYTLKDMIENFLINGLVLLFVFFDIFTARHINKNNNFKWDIIIISGIVIVHFLLVIICKEFLNIYQWDFLIIADLRQIISSFIIIYIIILNGYVIIYLISDNFFIKEEESQKDIDKNNHEKYGELEKKVGDEFEEKKEIEEKKNQSDNENKKGGNMNEIWEKKENIEVNKSNKGINREEKKVDDNNIEKLIKRNNSLINKRKYFIKIPNDNINYQVQK